MITNKKIRLNGLKNPKTVLRLLIILLFVIQVSCEEFVTVETPITRIASPSVFTDDATAISAISGIYSEMTNSGGFISGGGQSITHLAGLSADEFVDYTLTLENFEKNTLEVSTSTEIKNSLWDPGYKFIYYANSMIEGLEKSTAITEATKKQLTGEAKFIRAFCHFYLVNLFGDVPVVTATDYRINNKAFRLPKSEVYNQIISDLLDAQNLLSDDYIYSEGERTRPNKWAASALLSRVYLFNEDWDNAEDLSTAVINNTATYALTDLNNVFLMNSTEAIWQLSPSNPTINTNEAITFIPIDGPDFSTPTYVALTSTLLNSFESGDNRMITWVDSVHSTITEETYFYPYKYKIYESSAPIMEYYMMLRLAEQYLIRAEARARQDKIDEAIIDIDVIRQRAGLPLIKNSDPTINQDNLILAIEHERRIEFFAEWGHRWLDLKRTNRADDVLSTIKSPGWEVTDVLYPIPQVERQNNPNLTQNDGY
jgi:hypothetical protein